VYYMYCVLCVKWTVNLYIALCTWTCKVSCRVCLWMVMYLGSVLGFHFSVSTELHAVKFQTLARISCNWSIIFILALYGKVKWPKTKHVVVCWVISIVNLGQNLKKKGKWTVNLFFTLCVGTGPIAYCSN
jgi:hypothetical protein